jgi:hypothetical protein
MKAFPQPSTAAEGIDQDLSAVGGGLVRVGNLKVKFGFSLCKSSHATTSP